MCKSVLIRLKPLPLLSTSRGLILTSENSERNPEHIDSGATTYKCDKLIVTRRSNHWE